MAIQGVKGNFFELLFSTDKKVQDFMASLTPGDNLKGRVIEIIPAENKAIINFKGYNLVSQLPDGSTIQKGDIINVTVSQMDNRIFMKISAGAMGANIAAVSEPQNAMTPQQLMQALEGMKIPVNEQNLFIAQKLMDYHLPVTKESISAINQALNSYLQNRGIDPKVFSMDTPAAARELAISSFFRLGEELQKAADSLRSMAKVMESTGTQVMTRNDIAIRSMNTLNILNAAASATNGSAVLSAGENGMVMTLNNADKSVAAQVIESAVREGVINRQEAAAAIKALDLPQASVALGKDIIITRQDSKIDIRYPGLPAAIDTLESLGGGRAAADMKEAMSARMAETKAVAGVVSQAAVAIDITSMLSSDARALLAYTRDVFSALSRNVLTPQNTNLQENAAETAKLIRQLDAGIAALVKQANALNPKVSDPLFKAAGNLKADAAWSADAVKTAVQGLGFMEINGQISIKPQDYGKYQSVMKDFISKINGTELFNPAVIQKPGQASETAKPVHVNLPVDVESAIDALVFLKSRNLPADNLRLVDIMSRYFKNDLKLNQSVEKLATALTGFESTVKPFRNAQNSVKDAMQLSAGLKNIISDLIIKTNDAGLKAGLIEAQFRNFIDKSGMNLENRLLNLVPERPGSAAAAGTLLQAGQETNAVSPAQALPQKHAASLQPENAPYTHAADNLKSRAFEFLEKLGLIDDSKFSPIQKQAVKQAREAAGETLTNLNALQLINQRPVSFDMAYTQIPVFFNNKIFNGELQVWYRKGAPKEDLKNAATPVNMVFMLNTSNLGQVKVSMTVYKNEVECTVKAGNEKAKQALTRNRNEFLGSLEGLKYSVKNFSIQLEAEGASEPPASGEGYINIGRINLQA